MLQEQEEILQPGSSGTGEASNLIRFQVPLDKSGRPTPVRYDVVSDVIYIDVNSAHPDGFSLQETLKINSHSTDPYAQQVWELTRAQRQAYKDRYKKDKDDMDDMRDMSGIPQEIRQDVEDAEREEVITESKPVNERSQGEQMFTAAGEPTTRPQTQQGADLEQVPVQQMQSVQEPIQVPQPTMGQEVVMLNLLVSDGRSAIEDLGQLFELYVEDEKIKAFGANVVKRIQRKYYEYGVSEFNPDAEPAS